MNERQLYYLILKHFSNEDVKVLCLLLRVDYDDVAGVNRKSKIRELVKQLHYDDRLNDLIMACLEIKPHLINIINYENYKLNNVGNRSFDLEVKFIGCLNVSLRFTVVVSLFLFVGFYSFFFLSDRSNTIESITKTWEAQTSATPSSVSTLPLITPEPSGELNPNFSPLFLFLMVFLIISFLSFLLLHFYHGRVAYEVETASLSIEGIDPEFKKGNVAIPGNVYQTLRGVLIENPYFESDAYLKSLFVHESIYQWHYNLPISNSKSTRVSNLTYFLLNVKNANGENGLLLFLEVLMESSPSNLRSSLKSLILDLREFLD